MSESRHEEESGRDRLEAEPVRDRPAEEPVPKRSVRRGRVAAVAGALLLVGAVVAGVGYTVVTVRDADRDPGAPTWALPEGGATQTKPAVRAGLSGMLVPYRFGWTRGPDQGDFGSDTELGGERAAALAKEELRDLPRRTRRQMEKEIDEQHIQGMAIRSYATEARGIFFGHKTVMVTVVLTQMDRAAARDISTRQNELRSALGGLRKGPAVKGHKNAKCFLLPKLLSEDFDRMRCSAYQGNVLVSFLASGPGDLSADKSVAELLAGQLDRIKEPGAAV
ncbi:hypothetical protein ACFYNZ_14190 [Streptomyces kebangsaanensis]|uniref:Secreted protein n=1 Tax=Streptomyces kebangsaanensis TaxID=864058 RepID=A0ABW6KW53_9ACTN